MPHSADGDWFWNGHQWIAARSPDRAWWWDGTGWVRAGPAGPAGRVPVEYQATPWTRRLQFMVFALTAVGLVVAAITLPTIINQVFAQSIDQALSSQPGATPAAGAQLRQVLASTLNATLAIGIVFSVCLYAVLLVGVWKLWRWVFWYFLVVGFLAVLAIPQDLVYALGIGRYRLPLAFVIPSALQALAWLALSIWMVVLYRRYGTWARLRAPVRSVSASAGTEP